jgi:predicted SAM-dependent methyltransferase
MKTLLRQTLQGMGFEIKRVSRKRVAAPPSLEGISRIHYGCGSVVFDAPWINVDIRPVRTEMPFVSTDLTQAHPFPGNFFAYGYSEDFIEHLDQEESLRFLIEVHRTLRNDGVLRLACPSLEGALAHDFAPPLIAVALAAEAYRKHEHKHFYCKASLELVARHIGFSSIAFFEPGNSDHEVLKGLERRKAPLNIHAELTK